jgi:hypothetical protein
MTSVSKGEKEPEVVYTTSTRDVIYHNHIHCGADITCGLELTLSYARNLGLKPCPRCRGVDALADDLSNMKLQSSTTATGISMDSNAISTALHYSKSYKSGLEHTVPAILIADTEGKQFISQIAFMSIDDSILLCREIRVRGSDLFHHNPMSHNASLHTLKSVFDELNELTSEHKDVYIFFHNGRRHDEMLLKQVAGEEKFEIPERYHFGDTLELFEAWLRGYSKQEGGLGASTEAIYKQILGASLISDTRLDHTFYRLHMAHYDVMMIRSVIRFCIMYMCRPSSSSGSMREVITERRLHPDWPLGKSSLWIFWKWLETFYHQKWKTMKTIHGNLKQNPRRDDQLAVHTSDKSPVRHHPDCRFVFKYKLKAYTDWTILKQKRVCQICSTMKTIILSPRPSKVSSPLRLDDDDQVEGCSSSSKNVETLHVVVKSDQT